MSPSRITALVIALSLINERSALIFPKPIVHPSGFPESNIRLKRQAENTGPPVPEECKTYVEDFERTFPDWMKIEPSTSNKPVPVPNNTNFNQLRDPFNRLEVIQALKNTARAMDFTARAFLEASVLIVEHYSLNKTLATLCLQYFNLHNVGHDAIEQCEILVNPGQSCNETYKYRTIDGSCNNLAQPNWGKSFTCFLRLLEPDYADGYNSLRAKEDKTELPNARTVSTTVNNDVNIPNNLRKLITMQFGQFVDHDLTQTPMKTLHDQDVTTVCCNVTNPDVDCIPITIPPDDKFYSQFRQTCLNMVRSALCPAGCRAGPRQHTNQLTAFIDGSQVYGNTDDETAFLRSFFQGKLNVVEIGGKEFLPRTRNPFRDECSRPQKNIFCREAGDTRVNEQPGLTVMHTLWMRHHNYIATQLLKIKPDELDEVIFQTARQILIAQLSHITYNEFLRALLGTEDYRYFQLEPQSSGYTVYNDQINPGIFNEISAAVLRVGHTFIQNEFEHYDADYNLTGTTALKDFFFFPFDVPTNFDSFLRGLVFEPPQRGDRHVVEAVTNFLYKDRLALFGMDLVALNIQRARDRGIEAYIKHVQLCFGIEITTFEQLTRLMPRDAYEQIKSVYSKVEDVDLFPAAISEYPLPGGATGPTISCLLGIQFNRIKFGDRHYYEHSGEAGSFSPDQLDEIRKKTSLAYVICKNSGIARIQPYVFLASDPSSNPVIDCSEFQDPDFSLFI